MSLNLVLAYEASALAAPQSFRDAMQAAANILDSLIADNTVTIRGTAAVARMNESASSDAA
jgi:hypothetical protein